jgi:hypothetical protein
MANKSGFKSDLPLWLTDAPEFPGTQSGTVIDKIINNDKINGLRETVLLNTNDCRSP